MMKTTKTFTIDAELYLNFKKLCEQRRQSMSKIINKFMAIYVDQQDKGGENNG